MDVETIKKNFYELRRQKGISWAEIAQAAGVTNYQQIINYFNKGITLASLNKLAALLGVELYELIKPANENQARRDENNISFICPYCGETIYITKK